MDKLAKRLRDDAAEIEVHVSEELGDRIRASLEGTKQERHKVAASSRPAFFWWASSLSGVAAAVAVVAIINLNTPEPDVFSTEPPLLSEVAPRFDWRPKTAMLTETLEQELEDIRSDLKKAEQAVREDLEEIGVKALSERGL